MHEKELNTFNGDSTTTHDTIPGHLHYNTMQRHHSKYALSPISSSFDSKSGKEARGPKSPPNSNRVPSRKQRSIHPAGPKKDFCVCRTAYIHTHIHTYNRHLGHHCLT
ncbi:hypothetical protein BD289DRAFT_446979 [Coniella lustricola]|uniref:Uncharacterized protein n=1 Tax=Coniella lustricola TaxID=2025994 RepID=A0A2T2ZTG8_9PEZI|nr:hypothetical protein BD289DRAFT_446979 [Coniella lustricola]